MSETVVVLKTKDLCEEFEALINEKNLEVERVPGMPRFFVFPSMDPRDFPCPTTQA